MAILNNADVKDEELIATFYGAEEALINLRPLTYQSADIKDNVPLTGKPLLTWSNGGQFAPEVRTICPRSNR